MKFPSVSQVSKNAMTTFERFPFVILNVLLGTTASLLLIEHEGASGPTVLIPILFSALLGFPLLAGIALTTERWNMGRTRSIGAQIAGIVLLCLYGMTVPHDLSGAPAIDVMRMMMFTTAAALFAVTVPFLKHRNEMEFWNFCKALIVRALNTGVFAIVLWGGLAIALAALDNLFGVTFHERLYGEMWVFINGVFSVWFFLAGVPQQKDNEEEPAVYPKGLQILAQYILVPLVFIYFIILYVYLGKIILVWSWPQGWVSKLILGFIAMGIAAMLLVHPIKERMENAWLKRASQWFYRVIIPLIVMLFLAVWQRVSEYGITEGRYLGVAVAVWLVLFVSYFLLSRSRNILFITASLGAFVMIVSFGPWGMFSVSETSQVNRLKDLLIQQRILVDGKIQNSEKDLSRESTQQINSVLDYLSEVHGFASIQPWFSESVKRDSAGTGSAYKDPAAIAAMMGVNYMRAWMVTSGGLITYSADRDRVINIEGYERLLRGQRIDESEEHLRTIGEDISYRTDQELSSMTIMIGRPDRSIDSVHIDLLSMVNSLIARYGMASMEKVPPEEMTVTAAVGSVRVKLIVTILRAVKKDGKTQIDSYEAQIAYDRGK